MSCKHPLKGFYTFQQNSLQTLKDYDYKSVRLKGNRKIKVVPYSVNHLELIDGRLVWKYDDEISSFAKAVYTDFTEIPCGRCIECRLKRSREWANRCMLELPYHESSYFLTLTYDDNHLRYGDVHDENGFLVQNPTLYKKDLQDFFKRLRKNYKYDNHLKYYACGEYGDNTGRPHYHCIIFGLKLDDLQVYKQSRLGFNYYNSSFINSIWTFGHVVIADVSWETCAYTARYILKKQLGLSSDYYDEVNILPEFNVMSLKPAIGYEYFKDHKDEIYDLDTIYLKTQTKGLKIKPPKYFDNKMSENLEDAYLLQEVRAVRQEVADLQKKHKLEQTDLDYLDVLHIEEDLIKTRVKSLYRKEI